MPYEYFGDDERVYVSEFEEHAGDQAWRDEGDQVFEDMLDTFMEDYPEVDWETPLDEYDGQTPADMLYDGWFNEVDEFTRAEAIFDFFDVTGILYDDFPWDDWRDWYES